MASRRRVAAGAAAWCSICALAIPAGAHASSTVIDTVTVEVVLDRSAGAGAPAPAELAAQIAALGGDIVGAETGSVLLVEVPEAAAGALELAGADVRAPVHMNVPLQSAPLIGPRFGPIGGESAAAMGALDWHAAGYDGRGVRVGVIDYFNMSFWSDAEMGPKPTVENGRAMCRFEGDDCRSDFTQPAGNDDPRQHGPAVVEVIRDVAPAAELFIASAETYSDYLEVIDWFAANGVTIISRSLGTFIDGPGDGRGPTDELADYAVSKGMVWINAAGNEADGGYWRDEHPTIRSNGYVEFRAPGSTTGSEWLPVNGCTVAALRWNDWDTPVDQRSDYDLEVYRANANTATLQSAQSSRSIQSLGADPLEQVAGTCPTQTSRVFLKIKYVGGGTPADDVLELLDYDRGLSNFQAPYSATLPAVDSKNPSVLAVGAVDPVGGNEIGYYSSQGPTNDGRVKPDLVAPSGVRSSVYGTFSGTSAAAPAVAGAAALLLQSGSSPPGTALAQALRSRTTTLGGSVPNNIFGCGVLSLSVEPASPPCAVSPTAYQPLPEPRRVLDTRPTSPIGPSALIGQHSPGALLEVPVESLLGRGAGSVAAVALNLTIVDAATSGWVQVVPTRRASFGSYSNLNVDAGGQTRSNIVLVPVGDSGSISVYLGSGGGTLIDVLGTYDAAGATPSAGRFAPLDPVRVLDTRAASRVGTAGTGPNGALRRGESVCIDAAAAGVPADATVGALVLNVTATDVTEGGYVQALPTGGSIGSTSTLNLVAGGTVANTSIVPLGAPCGGSSRSVSVLLDAGSADASAQLVVDVTGYITGAAAPAAATGLFVPVTPARVVDTRPNALATGAVRTVQVAGAAGPVPAVPPGATGVAVNLTATGTRGWGYVTAWPAGTTRPSTSSLNWSGGGATVANGAILELSATGALDLESTTPSSPLSADHLLDVFGYYT